MTLVSLDILWVYSMKRSILWYIYITLRNTHHLSRTQSLENESNCIPFNKHSIIYVQSKKTTFNSSKNYGLKKHQLRVTNYSDVWQVIRMRISHRINGYLEAHLFQKRDTIDNISSRSFSETICFYLFRLESLDNCNSSVSLGPRFNRYIQPI